jgi:uncharacterized protein (DUF885 family)
MSPHGGIFHWWRFSYIFNNIYGMNFLMKKFLKSQMKGVPEDQVDIILDMMEKDPELFQKIAEEIKTEVSNGKDQMTASMEVMKRHESELRKLGS